MSYILDALKKSDQERQQGTSPSLHSKHGSSPPGLDSSSFKQHRTLLLIPGGFLLFFTCLGIFFFQYQGHFAEKDSIQTTETPSLSSEAKTSPPLVLFKEKTQILQPIAAQDEVFDRPVVFEKEAAQKSLPLLKELSSELQAEIPNLNLAGHTYSENPYQRMIIINGKILREGDMIEDNTKLAEINWEGVTIEFNGTRFQVKIN